MTLFDKNNTPVRDGDYLKGVHRGYYLLTKRPPFELALYLVCEAGHPCEDIPYAFVPELYEKVLPSEVKAAPAVIYPTHQILDPQTGEPIVSSITIGNLWVDAGHIKGVFYLAIADDKEKEHTTTLTQAQAATLRDFIDEQLKTPL